MQHNGANDTKEGCPKLPQVDQYPAAGCDESYPLVYRVEIVLRFDVVLSVVIVLELDDRSQVHRGVVEGYEPDAEYLEDRDV